MVTKVIKALMKANTEYTLIFYTREVVTSLDINIEISGQLVKEISINNDTRYRINITTPSNMTEGYIYFNGLEHTKQIYDIMLLDGNVDAPYFKGMKSAGECEDNKIEILSKTPNDIDDVTKYLIYSNRVTIEKINNHSFRASADGGNMWQQVGFRHELLNNVKPNDKFTLFIESATLDNQYAENVGFAFRNVKKNIAISNIVTLNKNKPLENVLIHFTVPSDYNGTDLLEFRMHINQNTPFENSITINNFLFTKGHVDISSFKPYGLNKKEISLNEPLRGLPNGVKDRFVKQGGKWYVERNCGEVVLDGSKNEYVLGGDYSSDSIITIAYTVSSSPAWSDSDRIICDRFINKIGADSVWLGKSEGITSDASNILIGISKSKLSSLDYNGARQWLQQNPTTVIYALATPIYEELPIDPTVNTYNDITHISNNSTIPCNMKIQNTGYNAIIKPSTQYTVAFNTDKSGEVGINLGGAKVTTTNNVATVTTPSTLVDDTLRLTGKGIKASKVRLLEGDKTNYIPSYFEGMQSSFEDKLQEDGTYKMEILSNNENLFNEDVLQNINPSYYQIVTKDGRRCLYGERPSLLYRNRLTNQLKPNTSYTISFDMMFVREVGQAHGLVIGIVYTNGMSNTVYASSYNNWANIKLTTPSDRSIAYIHLTYGTNIPTYIDLDSLIIKETNSNNEYIPHKSNKIQFSSIEPLRGVENVKDKFVFKDGKLMIERNCGEVVVNGDYVKGTPAIGNTSNVIYVDIPNILGSVSENIPNAICNNRVWLMDSGIRWGSSPHNTFVVRPRTTSKSVWFVAPADIITLEMAKEYLNNNPTTLVYQLKTPIYEEVSPHELQKIILEGYENGTLFFDTNIPPTVTTTYAGETPIVKATRLNKTEVLNNTNDINDNIVPYLMDMDYRVVCLQLEGRIENISMARLFGGTFEMLQRDILSNRYSKEEYKYRLDAYLSANKITESEYNKLGDMLNE